MFRKKIHVFRAGSQTSAQGVERNFTEKELQQVVDTYDPGTHTAPLVLGHQGDSDSLPSFGWIQGFTRDGDDLYADVDFTDVAKDLVKDGHYRKVSISFYSPDSTINPHKGKWSARHLALLGAAPPAVKGLSAFNFNEESGVFDFAVALTLDKIFDDELGPTMIVEKSPLEMLKEKLDEVRKDVSSAVQDLEEETANQKQTDTNNAGADATPATEADAPADGGNDKQGTNQHFTENTQQIANLEDQFPEEHFMEDKGKISRKRTNGANGQVMQIVENVYDEQHGEMPAAFKANAEKMKAKAKGHKEEGGNPFADEHAEVSHKTVSGGKVHFGTHPEGETMEEDRMDTARSDSDSYAKRMTLGEEGKGAVGEDRMHTARSSEQDEDRLNTAKNGEQEVDRKRTAKDGSKGAVGESRWAGQSEAEERTMNNDQYDTDAKSYGVNSPKTANGAAGRAGGPTKFPTETEESPDNTVFAVDTENVMDDHDMRVLRKKSSDGRTAPKVAQNFKEPIAAEETSELGVTAHAEDDDADGDFQQGKAKFRKGQLEPGQFEGGPAEVVGPDGSFAEVPRGEKKSTKPQLTPGEFDQVDEAAEHTGPDGAYSEDVRDGEGELGDYQGGPNQKTKRSGGVFSEEHGEKKNPYTKTGFGSTYDESEDDGEDDFSEADLMVQMLNELEALKAENDRIKNEYREAKISARRSQISSFVEALYEEGRLTDGVMPQSELQNYCEGLEFGTVEFSEGETAATKLLGLLSKLPPMVSYGEYVPGGTFQYSEQDLDPHTAALQMVAASEGKLDYVEALKKTMFS